MELKRKRACAPVRNSSLILKLVIIFHVCVRGKKGHLQAQRNIPIAILIVLLKHIRHSLQANTRLHEQIETQRILASTIIRAIQQRDELLTQAIPECDQRFVEFRVRYAAGMILVEAVEETAPCGEETP